MATASSTLGNEMERTGSRKLRSQAGAELGRQEPVETALADDTAGMLACCVALASCPLGALRGVGVPGAALARLVASLQRLMNATSGWCLEEDLEDLETRLREFVAAAETRAPVRFMGALW